MEALSTQGRRLIGIKILLVVCIGNFVSFLDRINVSYAALEMNKEIGLTPELYGFGAGAFFISYACFALPSSYFLTRLGAPIWLGLITLLWGICSAGLGLVHVPASFFTLRFLLGVCEAGFAPGVYFYLAQWYPKSQLGRVNSAWMIGSLVSTVVAGPLAAFLLPLHVLGMSGWRWMFFVEGVPAVLLGTYIITCLPRGPQSAKWLSVQDQQILVKMTKVAEQHGVGLSSFWNAFGSGRVWIYALCLGLYLTGAFGFFLWLPQVIHSVFAGSSSSTVSLVATIPWLCAGLGTVIFGITSDRTGDRRWHLVVTALWVGTCLIVGTRASSTASFGMLCLVAFGLNAFISLFLAVTMGELRGVGAAAALAIINAVGGVGGFIGPYIFGVLRQYTGSFQVGMIFFGCATIAAGLLPLLSPGSFPRIRESTKHYSRAKMLGVDE